MKFHRISKPLTALALCALLATAYYVTATPSFAADTKKVAAKKTQDEAKDEAQTKTAATDDKKAADGEEESDIAEGEDDILSDDIMPPMATASKTEVPMDLPSPNDSKIAPDVKRMRTVDLDTVGSSDAYTESDVAGPNGTPYVEPVGETHPTLNLTPDKSIIVRLDRPAASVLVGNDAHVNVLIDTPTTLVVIPRMPGASYFTVLDQERRIVMKRHVIVGPGGQYVRVRRSCANTSSSACQHTSTFYCPDGMCHPIETQQRPGSAPQQSQASVGGASAPGTMSSDGADGSDYSGEAPAMPEWPFIPIPIPFPGFGADTTD